VVLAFIPRIVNKYVRQPWPFSVTWRHRTRDIRFAICHFLLWSFGTEPLFISVFGDIGP